jgi:hypothetical protein
MGSPLAIEVPALRGAPSVQAHLDRRRPMSPATTEVRFGVRSPRAAIGVDYSEPRARGAPRPSRLVSPVANGARIDPRFPRRFATCPDLPGPSEIRCLSVPHEFRDRATSTATPRGASPQKSTCGPQRDPGASETMRRVPLLRHDPRPLKPTRAREQHRRCAGGDAAALPSNVL